MSQFFTDTWLGIQTIPIQIYGTRLMIHTDTDTGRVRPIIGIIGIGIGISVFLAKSVSVSV